MSYLNPKFFIYIFTISIVFAGCPGDATDKKDSPRFEVLDIYDVTTLDRTMSETSGMASEEGKLWTHNDNGNTSELFRFNPEDGRLTKVINLDEIKNRDWEEISIDSNYLYVGDIGNNEGDRNKLRVCRFDRSVLQSDSTDIKIEPEKIGFFYPGRPDKLAKNRHDYDAEAFLTTPERVYIFTKNWKNQECNLWSIPNEDGEWEATLISSFDAQGLITSAAYLEGSSDVVLLGYMRGTLPRPFIWVLSGYQQGDFFSGQKKRYNLDTFGQSEAIIALDENTLGITSERGKTAPAKFYKVDLP